MLKLVWTSNEDSGWEDLGKDLDAAKAAMNAKLSELDNAPGVTRCSITLMDGDVAIEGWSKRA